MLSCALRVSPRLSHVGETSGTAYPIALSAPPPNRSRHDVPIETPRRQACSAQASVCEEPLRILLTSRHRYPAGGSVGMGRRPNSRTTGGASIIHDLLAKGLAELGHEVFYQLEYGHDLPPPQGVQFVNSPPHDVDIHHYYNSWFLHLATTVHELAAWGIPWIASCHIDGTGTDQFVPGHRRGDVPTNWVVVSRTLARLYGHRRCVPNGIDPSVMVYSASKGDYFLFASRAEAAQAKGIDQAIELSRASGVKLVVMASSTSDAVMDDLLRRCKRGGTEFVGDVRGAQKAELFAGARALLFPTQLNEAFGLVIAEALMSGTPVIASRRGACTELVTPDVGFVCETRDDYLRAVDRIGDISAEACRAKAMAEFHYLRMARDYVREYRIEIENHRVGANVKKSGSGKRTGCIEHDSRLASERPLKSPPDRSVLDAQ
jgi:glycosyltransferase involved in cell wall biosynthesis